MWNKEQWKENEEECKKIKQKKWKEGIKEGKNKKLIVVEIQNFKVPHMYE
jgi:hypothetical protein